MKKVLIVLSLLIVIVSAASVKAAETPPFSVSTIKFPVTINHVSFDEQKNSEYPMFLYNNITYFPLTYSNLTLAGLNIDVVGTKVMLGCEKNIVSKMYERDQIAHLPDGESIKASESPYELFVNGEKYKDEKYPILFHKDIVYIPLTWDLTRNKLNWDFWFDGEKMEIYTSGFYYTSNGDSYIKLEEDGSRMFASVENKSYYNDNNVRVYVSTATNRLGPLPSNMIIESNGEKKKIPGYTGYYQKSGPLFTVEDGYVYSVHYSDHDARNPRQCKISIDTGEIEYLE